MFLYFVHTGLLYAVGGFDGMAPLSSAECYDPRTNSWTALPDMTTKRFGLGACACEGRVYIPISSDTPHSTDLSI